MPCPTTRSSRRRYGCAGFTVETEDQLEASLAAAFTAGRSAVVDVRCDPEEKCLPDGAGRRSCGRRDRGAGRRWCGYDRAHDLRPSREQAGRAGAGVAALLAARLQHPEPRGRADRTHRHLAAHPPGRLQRALARADREADAQAGQRASRHRARPDEAVERELALFTVAVAPDAGRISSRSARSRARASPTSAATRSSSISSAVPTRSRRSKS